MIIAVITSVVAVLVIVTVMVINIIVIIVVTIGAIYVVLDPQLLSISVTNGCVLPMFDD